MGLPAAVNQGVSALETRTSPATESGYRVKTSIEELEAACLQAGTGIAAGQLTDEHGRPQRGFTLRRFPSASTLMFEVLGINRLIPANPLNRSYRCLDLDLTRPEPPRPSNRPGRS